MHCTQPCHTLTKSVLIGKEWEYRFCFGVEARGFVSLPAKHNLKPEKVRAEWDQCGPLWGTMKKQSPQVDAGVGGGPWHALAAAAVVVAASWAASFLFFNLIFDLTAVIWRESHIINNTLTGKAANFHINTYCWYLNALTWFTLQLHLFRY